MNGNKENYNIDPSKLTTEIKPNISVTISDLSVLNENNLFWAKAHPDTIIPTKSNEDAGYDIYARFDEPYIIIEPNETKMIPTDLHCAFPSGYAMILKERGSTGTKGMGGRSGVIDSGFRGKIFVPITNHNNTPLAIVKDKTYAKNTFLAKILGEYTMYPYEKAICQAVMQEVPKLQSQEITLDELLTIDSERGQGMLGDSGK